MEDELQTENPGYITVFIDFTLLQIVANPLDHPGIIAVYWRDYSSIGNRLWPGSTTHMAERRIAPLRWGT
jgi:hypothetical protein